MTSGRAAGSRAKVLHVCAIDASLRLVLGRQLRYLREAGYDVHAACTRSADTDAISRDLGVPVHGVTISRRIDPAQDLASLAGLVALYRRERFDIVHLHFPKSTLLGAMAARAARVPYLVNTVRPMFQPHQPLAKRQLLMSLDRFTGALCTHLLAQNPDDATYYPAQWVCPPSKISAIGNGIQIERFDPDALGETRAEIRASMGLPEDAFVVGHVGRYTVEKGYREFFEAVAELAKDDPTVHFVTAGSQLAGERAPVPKDLPDRLGIGGRGVQLGQRSDMPRVFAAMDVMLFPSHREACPRSPMEAGSMGVPVVASELRGCRWSIVEGQNGYLVPVGDVAGFTARVRSLKDDPDKRAAFGRAARALALERFDERRMFEEVARCYEALLAGRKVTGVGREEVVGVA